MQIKVQDETFEVSNDFHNLLYKVINLADTGCAKFTKLTHLRHCVNHQFIKFEYFNDLLSDLYFVKMRVMKDSKSPYNTASSLTDVSKLEILSKKIDDYYKNIFELVTIQYFIDNNKIDELEYLFNLYYDFFLENYKTWEYSGIMQDKDNLSETIQCISDKTLEKMYEERFINYLKNKNKEGLFSLVTELNNLSKLEWIRRTMDPSIKDRKILFIGHSVDTVNTFEKFRTDFVSCSLFDNVHLEPFKRNYGFIMNPAYIVAASDRDLFAFNDAFSTKHVVNHTPVPIIKGIDSLIQSERASGEYEAVNEVLVQDFKPLGLFHFTFGIEGLDYYSSSKPDEFEMFREKNNKYKVYEYDTLKYGFAEGLINVRENLLTHLYRRIGVVYHPKYLNSFNSFFDELSDLKDKEKATYEKALTLFKKHEERIDYQKLNK